MKKLFFFDIDGTLLSTPTGLVDISDKNKEAFRALQAKGHSLFIATGRTKCFIVDPIYRFGFDGYVTCNGAYVEYEGKPIFKHPFENKCLEKLIQVCDQFQFDYYIEGVNQIYVNDKQKESVHDFALRWEMKQDVMVDQFDVEKIEAYIAMVEVNQEEDIDKLMRTLGDDFDISRHPGQLSFDLNVKGINKGKGIEALLRQIHFPKEDTYAFGDGNNDLEMIEAVGCGIAMGNGVEPLKQVAKMVTLSVQEDGVYDALKKLQFIK